MRYVFIFYSERQSIRLNYGWHMFMVNGWFVVHGVIGRGRGRGTGMNELQGQSCSPFKNVPRDRLTQSCFVPLPSLTFLRRNDGMTDSLMWVSSPA